MTTLTAQRNQGGAGLLFLLAAAALIAGLLFLMTINGERTPVPRNELSAHALQKHQWDAVCANAWLCASRDGDVEVWECRDRVMYIGEMGEGKWAVQVDNLNGNNITSFESSAWDTLARALKRFKCNLVSH